MCAVMAAAAFHAVVGVKTLSYVVGEVPLIKVFGMFPRAPRFGIMGRSIIGFMTAKRLTLSRVFNAFGHILRSR